MRGHLKHMAIGGGAILVVLLVLGVDLRAALPWALLLACPLMMVGMMFMMNRNHGAGAVGQASEEAGRDAVKIGEVPNPGGHLHV